MKKELENNSSLSSSGIHVFSVMECKSPEAKNLESLINKLAFEKQFCKTEEQHRSHWEQYRYLIEKFEHKFLKSQFAVKNVTTTVGRSVIAQRLGGTTTYTGTVNYTALGDDNTAPVVGDATLGNETYRKALSSGTFSNNIAYLETFYTAAEVTGTFEEYGMFIDGSGTVDTGQLFNRFTATITKSGVETLNVQSIITINDN